MFSYYRFLNEDPRKGLGAQGDRDANTRHHFTEIRDWGTLLEKHVEPPFQRLIKEVRGRVLYKFPVIKTCNDFNINS